jgi:hypothetical protein
MQHPCFNLPEGILPFALEERGNRAYALLDHPVQIMERQA